MSGGTMPEKRLAALLLIGFSILFVSLSGGRCSFAGGDPRQDEPAKSTSVSPPDWFRAGDHSVGESDFIFVSTEGQPNQSLAEAALLRQLREQIGERLENWFGGEANSISQLSSNIIRQELVVEDHFSIVPYEDELTRSAAAELDISPIPYYRGYAEIELTPEFRQLADRWRHRTALEKRLGMIGLGSGTLLGSLAILFAYLKLDHATRNHYSRRLQLVAFAAFCALAAGVVTAINTLL
jgi:hypothetical protein